MSVVGESLRVEKTRIERSERRLATDAEILQQFLAERRETSKKASPQPAVSEDFLQGLRSKVCAITAKQNEWYDLANEASEKLKTAEANVALHPSLQEATLKEIGAHTAEVAELQEQLTARSAKLSELLAKVGMLADELGQVKTQNMAVGTASNDLKSVARNC